MPKVDRFAAVMKGLAELRAAGRKEVDLEALEKWVASIPPAGDDSRAFEEWQTKAPLKYAGRLEAYRATLEAGQTGLKTLLVMNGGAAVALLAFLGGCER